MKKIISMKTVIYLVVLSMLLVPSLFLVTEKAFGYGGGTVIYTPPVVPPVIPPVTPPETPPVTPPAAENPPVTPATPATSDDSANYVAKERSLVTTVNEALSNRLSGRILLQVEAKGEAWYVNPLNTDKYYLGRPADAFGIMRNLGLGINNRSYNSFNGIAPARLAGRILINVDDFGRAYYVNPVDLRMHYLGRPADAFNVMRNLGLGITNANLRQITVN